MTSTSVQFTNNTKDRRKEWLTHFLKFVVLFVSALAILSLFRAFFLFYFSKGIDAVTINSVLPALWMGIRVDAKWLSLSLIPAYWKPFLYKYSTLFAGLGLICMVFLNAVNFGFFSFYKTPISSLVFGFLQDDTRAILQTLWHDWPIFNYLSVLLIGLTVPLLISGFSFNGLKANPKSHSLLLLGIVSILLLAFFIRGSIGKFPLRQEEFSDQRRAFSGTHQIRLCESRRG